MCFSPKRSIVRITLTGDKEMETIIIKETAVIVEASLRKQ